MISHKIFHKKLNRKTSSRLSLVKNNTLHLVKYKSIKITKPVSHSTISFASRFFTRLLKQKEEFNAIRYIRKNLSCNTPELISTVLDFYKSNKENIKCNYISKQKLYVRKGDGASIVRISLI